MPLPCTTLTQVFLTPAGHSIISMLFWIRIEVQYVSTCWVRPCSRFTQQLFPASNFLSSRAHTISLHLHCCIACSFLTSLVRLSNASSPVRIPRHQASWRLPCFLRWTIFASAYSVCTIFSIDLPIKVSSGVKLICSGIRQIKYRVLCRNVLTCCYDLT